MPGPPSLATSSLTVPPHSAADGPNEPARTLTSTLARELGAEGALADRLTRALVVLRQVIGADACSVYRLVEPTGDLVLAATVGLASERVEKVILRKGEGLTGLVVRSKKPVAVRDGPSHPSFRYVPEIREEAFHSYLGLPLLLGRRPIGALVAQTVRPRDFTREDIALAGAAARQIAAAATSGFRQLQREIPLPPPEVEAPAIPAADFVRARSLSPGCFLGAPWPFDHGLRLETLFTPRSRGVEAETEAIRRANRQVRKELKREAGAITGAEGQAVLTAHAVILRDVNLAEEVLDRIRKGDSAAEAVRATALKWIRLLEHQPDASFAARAVDFRDIANRLLRALGLLAVHAHPARGKVVAVARAILPGDLLTLGPERLGALVLTDQGIHSHTAILARAYGIPAVQIEEIDRPAILNARRLLVDGAGLLLIDPDSHAAVEYIERARRWFDLPEGGPSELHGPVKTRDGLRVLVGLNAGRLADFRQIDALGPDDIGLYRTEIPFMARARMPGVGTQTAHFRQVLKLAGGRRVTFRLFDFGGDKTPPWLALETESNPMMGARSLRLLLKRTDLLQLHLRALLQAADAGPMGILLPMVSTPEELHLALDELHAVGRQIELQGRKGPLRTPIGVMIEVPSLLFMIPELARWVDFFCVGTNDLVQYLMAADRSNAGVARLYQWHHPAVLGALDHLLRHCQRHERPVIVCGEMAAHPWAAMMLVGLGYERLSVDGSAIPLIKWTLLQTDARMLRRLAQASLQATSSTEVLEHLYGALAEIRRETPPLARKLESSLERLRTDASW